MSSSEVNKAQLYNELNKFGINGDYVRALKVSNKVLNAFPHDEKAFQCKIVCLLYLSRFEDALQAFSKAPHLSNNLTFEKAHCQYRLNLNQQALDTLNSCNAETIKMKELKAQIFYRIERYEECFQIYTEILKNSSDEYEEERHTNLAAIIANLILRGKDIEMPSFMFDSYELSYNVACYLIFKGQYLEAERKLKHAEKLCKESTEEGSTDDIEEDLSIIRLQLGYAIHLQGREKEAKAIYNAILKSKPNDVGVLAITSNNSVTVNKEQSLFDSKKKMKSALSESAQQKLTSWQNKQIAVNNCLLNLRTGQLEQAVELCTQLVEKYPSAEWISALVNATVFIKEDKKTDAINLLSKCSQKFPEYKMIMSLTIAQMLIVEGDYDKACDIFEDLTQLQFKPGIVSALASLYLETGKRDKAADLLQKAVSWHQVNKIKSSNLSQLWRNAAELNLRSGHPEAAARSLEEMLKNDPNNVMTLAQLIGSYAKFDVKKARQFSIHLSNLIDMTPNIDIDALEATNWIMGLKAIRKAAKIDHTPATPSTDGKSGQVKPTSKKKKKNKRPKNYDPSGKFVPDPERWLPRFERSNYRKKKDRRTKEVGKGTQGSATSGSDQFDITKMASQKSNAPSPSASTDHLKHQRKSAVHSKKKKKGGKW